MIEILDIVCNAIVIVLSYFATVLMYLLSKVVIEDYKNENLIGKMLIIGFVMANAIYLIGLDIFLPLRLIDKLGILQ